MEHKQVIIAGAGPVGLFIALRLAQAGISTLVLERHHDLVHTTRACVYQPIVLKVLESLGVLDLFHATASQNRQGFAWRDISGKALAELPMVDDEYVLLIGQWRMNRMLLQEIQKYSCVEVKFSHYTVGVEQDESSKKARVMVHRTALSDDVVFSADWVIAADGANSTVRRSLCIPFEGYTYHDIRMIGADVLYDFVEENGWNTVNFIVDPEDWAVVAYTGEDEHGEAFGSGRGRWRVAYGEPMEWDVSREAVWARAQERVKKFTGGREDFQITRAEPYQLHHKCAQQARKGRVVLAGDALHTNNPMGGLGLTSGILDAFAYGNALVRIIRGGEPDSLMTECSDARKQAWQIWTGPSAISNLDRVRSDKEDVALAREAFFENLRTDQGFPRKIRVSMNEMLKDDFSGSTGTTRARL